MSNEELLDNLDGEWTLFGARIRKGHHCPLTYVAYKKLGISIRVDEAISAAKLLGISEKRARVIMDAADNYLISKARSNFRKQIIKKVKYEYK